ncbi:MAG: glycosyltransferase family 2 protein [Candidatus Aenigmarchaeota archaeon]|nr:glycosyltransferase family 2 protein [Candidatus Aenigmarchaeota archaeon]
MSLSIIIPTKNEEENIGNILKKVKKKLKNKVLYEVIVADSSSDKTPIVAKKILKKLKLNGRVLRVKKQGKGYAIKYSSNFAKGNYILMIDADLQYSFEDIASSLKYLKDGVDVILTRRIRTDEVKRRILSFLFRFLVFLFFGMIEETQSTARIIKRKIWKEIVYKIREDGWLWDVELIYYLKKYSAKFKTVKIRYEKRRFGKSKIGSRTLVNGVVSIFKIRVRTFLNSI